MNEHLVAAIIVVLAVSPLFVLGFFFRGERGPRLLETSGKGNVRDPRSLATFIGNGLIRVGAVHLPFAAALPFLTPRQIPAAALVLVVVVIAIAIHFVLGLLQRQSK